MHGQVAQHLRSLWPKGHPPTPRGTWGNLGETRGGVGKNGALEHKSGNISETRTDSLMCLYFMYTFYFMFVLSVKGKKGKVTTIYTAVLHNRGLLQDRFCASQYPLDHCAIHGSYKQRQAYELSQGTKLLLGEQRHIGVNNLPKVVAICSLDVNNALFHRISIEM